MTRARYKTMRHIETVRNYLNMVIREFLARQELHDQTKLEEPEAQYLEEYTEKLRGITYGSEEYKKQMAAMQPGIDHHYKYNSHHPEHYPEGINGMNLFDLMEMICDWKAATLRHNDGDIRRSLEINKQRYNIDAQLFKILENTVDFIERMHVFNKAEES